MELFYTRTHYYEDGAGFKFIHYFTTEDQKWHAAISSENEDFIGPIPVHIGYGTKLNELGGIKGRFLFTNQIKNWTVRKENPETYKFGDDQSHTLRLELLPGMECD